MYKQLQQREMESPPVNVSTRAPSHVRQYR